MIFEYKRGEAFGTLGPGVAVSRCCEAKENN